MLIYRYVANLRPLSITIKTKYTYLQSVYVHLLSLFIYKKEVDFNHEYKYTWTASVKKKTTSKIEFLQMHYYFLYVIIPFDFRL